MKYLVIVRNEASTLAHMDEEDLMETKQEIQKALDTGTLLGAYAFVGGGFVWIVECESHSALARSLRSYGIFNAEVAPIIEALGLVDGYRRFLASDADKKS
jgi:hypothetical protein